MEVLPAAQTFADKYHTGLGEPLLRKVADGLPFDGRYWQLIVGEMLLFAALEVPEIQTAADTLSCLLDPERYGEGAVPRERFGLVQQAHYGARHLLFGGRCYRPEFAGFNDLDDVARLTSYLVNLDPTSWTAADLKSLPGMADEEERCEELDFARDCFSELTELYGRADRHQQIVVSEIL